MLILFDGVCNLCNSSVQFVIRHDPRAEFKFASLQSPRGQAELKRFGLDGSRLHSVILIDGDRCYERSDAALKIAGHLTGPSRWLKYFLFVPRFIRNPIYNLIAKNRYRMFGHTEECMIPTPEIRQRFVE